MKKIILPFLLLVGFTVNAQLPNGSVAPDFTLTDIDGVSHNLYTYLDQGKTVFIDVSATWCGPCWNYHNTGALEDLWVNHGPTGGNGVSASTSNDVIVLYIEGDGSTNSADLHGTGSNTQGDWVTGVEHPIIDPSSSIINAFNTDYNINAFPTIYKICPNRIIENAGQASAAALYSAVADCPPPASAPSDVSALTYKGNSYVCGPADYTPKVQIQNTGLNTLTEATITVSYNGQVVSTGSYTGSLATYGLATVTCSPISNFSGGDLTVSVTTANDANQVNGTMSKSIQGAIDVANQILLSIVTDAYASEISWNIKKSTGSLVLGTNDPTLVNNTSYDFAYTMPALGCYTFNITDGFGDGISAPGSIYVRDSMNNIILNSGDYGAGITIPFKVVENPGYANVKEMKEVDFEVYPNPSAGKFTIKSSDLTNFQTIELVDQLGRRLNTWKVNTTVMDLEVKNVANGTYNLVFKNGTSTVFKQIQILK